MSDGLACQRFYDMSDEDRAQNLVIGLIRLSWRARFLVVKTSGCFKRLLFLVSEVLNYKARVSSVVPPCPTCQPRLFATSSASFDLFVLFFPSR